MKYTFLFMTVILLASSCATSNISGIYNRTYKVCSGAMPSTIKQKFVVNPDSSFILIDYKDEFSKNDSSLTYGIIKSEGNSKLYVLKDTSTNNMFCIFKKGGKLFFITGCDKSKKYRYSNPFVKENQ